MFIYHLLFKKDFELYEKNTKLKYNQDKKSSTDHELNDELNDQIERTRQKIYIKWASYELYTGALVFFILIAIVANQLSSPLYTSATLNLFTHFNIFFQFIILRVPLKIT